MLCESSGYVRNTLLCIVENPTQFQALAMPKVLSWSWRKEGLTRVIHFMLTTSTPAFLWPDSCCPEESISVELWSVTGDRLQTLSPKQNYVLVMVNHYFWELWLLIIWMVVLRNFHFLGDSFRMLHILVINVLFILLLHQLFYLPEECHLMKLYAMPFWYLIMH